MPLHGRSVVLLVEDDADGRELLAEVLEPDFDVMTAETSQQALELFEARGRAVDVVITDEALPGLRGTQLAREVKRRAPATRVVLVSGYAQVPDTGACDRVLRKPLDPAELMATLAELSAEPEDAHPAW